MKRTRQRQPLRNKDLSGPAQRFMTFWNIGMTIPECKKKMLALCSSISGYDEYIGGNIDESRLNKGKKIFQSCLDDAYDEGYIFKMLLKLMKRNTHAFNDAREMVDPQYRKYFNRIAGSKQLVGSIPSMMADPTVMFYKASKTTGHFVALQKPITFKNKNETMQVTMVGCIPFARDYRTVFALTDLMMGKEKEVIILQNNMAYFTATPTEICTKMKMKNPSGESAHNFLSRSLLRLRSCGMMWEWQEKGKPHISIGGILAKATTLEAETSSGELGIYFDLDFFGLFEFGHLNPEDIIYELPDEETQFYIYSLKHKFNNEFGGKYGYGVSTVYDNLPGFGKKQKSEAAKKRKVEKLVKSFKARGIIRSYDKKLLANNRVKFTFKRSIKRGEEEQPLLPKHEVTPKKFFTKRDHKQNSRVNESENTMTWEEYEQHRED